jgi:hypothetical protein
MAVITGNFILGADVPALQANAGQLFLNIKERNLYRQKRNPYGNQWEIVQSDVFFEYARPTFKQH